MVVLDAGELMRLEVEVPRELIGRMDEIMDLLGLRSREEFLVVMLKRFLDNYEILLS